MGATQLHHSVVRKKAAHRCKSFINIQVRSTPVLAVVFCVFFLPFEDVGSMENHLGDIGT